MDLFNNLIEAINDIIWHDYVLYIVLGVGVLFTIWSGFCQWRALTHGTQVVRGKYDDPDDPGAISHFQALSAALSATVGLGNIAGVAIAIAIGGPGAVFWMWMIGLAGMALKTTEVTLAMLYRNTDDPNNPHGGPMWVAAKGFKRWGMGGLGTFIGGLFCVTLLVSTITGGNMFQAWNVADITYEAFNIPGWVTGLVLAIIVAAVIIGGIKRIGHVASVLVPFMCVIYIITAIVVLIINAGEIPAMFGLIFDSAFSPQQATGAFVGATAGTAFLWGMKRALFSSEAGQGSSPIAHSAAKTDEPVREAVVAGLEPFIDTIVVCTLTSLVILSTGALDRGGDNGEGEATFASTPQVTVIETDGKPHWTVGEPREFTVEGEENEVAGVTALPPRHEEATRISGGDWRGGDAVYVIAAGGSDREDTASDRVAIFGEVKVPEEADADPYIRWETLPVDEDKTATWQSLADSQQQPTLINNEIYKDYKGATLTAYSINRTLPGYGTYLILLASWLFAISTMISWSYYGEQGVVFLFGEGAVGVYKIIYCLLIVVATVGIVTTTKELDNLTALGTGVMLWSNIPIMLIFGYIAMRAYFNYFRRMKEENAQERAR